MSQRMRFALIGYGAWGRYHARAISRAHNAALSVIAANSEANAAAAAQDWPDAKIVREPRLAWDDPSVEAVAIATPNHLHADMAVAALKAGKHVLLEKPMATTLADCDRIVLAVRRYGRVLTVGHEQRLSPLWGRIKTLIVAGAIGQPEHVHVSLFRFPYRQGSGGWRYDLPRVGSWILEEPIHFFDAVLWYLADVGEPRRIVALATGDPALSRVLTVSLRFPHGVTATINQVLAGFEHHQTIEVVGSAGAIRALWSGVMDRTETPTASLRLKRAGSAQDETIAVDRSGEVFELEMQVVAAVDGFRTGRAIVSAEEGRAAVALCLAAERSAREGREIAVDGLSMPGL